MRRRDFLIKASAFVVSAAALSTLRFRTFLITRTPANQLPEYLSNMVTSGDSNFAEASQGFNKRFVRLPRAVSFCKSAQEVSTAIQWAKKNSIPVSVRGGRHSYEGYSTGSGLVIDTSPMNAIEVDLQSNTATIQAGCRIGDVDARLLQDGMILPAGSCPSVGIAGLALGGGYGYLARKYGLTADHLLEIEMIDAQGKRITANSSQNPELYWASRGGGGGNFGVVTSLKFRIRPIGEVSVFHVDWTEPGIAATVLDAWQNWAPHTVDELTCSLEIEAHQKTLRCSGVFLGTQTQLAELLRPLTKIKTAKLEMWNSNYQAAVRYFGGNAHPKPIYFKGKSDFAQRVLTRDEISILLKNLDQPFSGAAILIFENFGGAINDIPRDATAYCHRKNTLFHVQYYVSWKAPEDEASALQWTRNLYQSARGFFSGESYVNYCDSDLIHWPRAYFGENLERLIRVKADYDPENFFNFEQSIPIRSY